MSEIDSAMLIKADAGNNNNKFYELKLFSDGTVKARYGRVGTDGQRRQYSGGRKKFDRIISQKTAPENPRSKKGGYTHAKVLRAGASKGDLATIAAKQIKYASCKEVESLISKLVSWNTHNITEGTTLVVNSSGQVELPSGMGVLTPQAVSEARDLLAAIAKQTRSSKTRTANINAYLRLVPQRVPSRRGWIENIFKTPREITKQESLLDSLEAAVGSVDVKNTKKLFDLEISKVSDQKTIGRIEKLFKTTRQGIHQSSHLNVSGIYKVCIGYMSERFNSCNIGNVQELWHGTRVGNLLSILKSGLVIPKHAAHGRNFGDGIYFSDQSTKALNYASGYWSGNRRDNCFMFLADVRMGKSYTPMGHGNRYYGCQSYPIGGYDSTFAKGGESGVRNNEMIVYSLDQVNLKYLVEFSN